MTTIAPPRTSRLGRALVAACSGLRRDTERLAAAVRRLDGLDRERAAALLRWLDALDGVLEQHHRMTDDVMVPRFARHHADLAEARCTLADDHAALHVALGRVRAGLEAVAAGDRWGAHGLAVAAADLRDGLADHLEREQTLLLTALSAPLSDDDRATIRSELRARVQAGPSMFMAWLVEGLPAREKAEILSLAPTPARMRARLVGGRRYARLVAAAGA